MNEKMMSKIKGASQYMAAIDDFPGSCNNEEHREKINSATSAPDTAKIAANAGFSITEAELIQAYRSRMAEMSEEQLSSVAGGKNDSNKKSACCKNN